MRKGVHPQPGQLALFDEAVPPAREPLSSAATALVEEPLSTTALVAGDAGPLTPYGQAAGDDEDAALPALGDYGAHGEAPVSSALGDYGAPVPVPTRPQRQQRAAVRPASLAMAASRVPPSPQVTLDQAIPDYLTFLAALGRSRHTLKSFELDLRLLRGQLGNRQVGSIDTGHLRQFIAWVRVSRDNTANSLRRKVATLKNFFGYLRDEGYLTSSPADALPYPEVFQQLPEFLEADAAARLVAVTEDNVFWRTLILLLLDTGLKRDEVLALRVADVHLEPEPAPGSYLVVRETDAAKRLRSRQLPIGDRLREALLRHYATTRYEGGDSRVLEISVRGINFIVEVCGQRAGIETSKPRLTPQVLRETFAVMQMRARVREERQRQAEGWKPEQLQLLTLQHDAEVLELLGLKDDPITARKYRQLAL